MEIMNQNNISDNSFKLIFNIKNNTKLMWGNVTGRISKMSEDIELGYKAHVEKFLYSVHPLAIRDFLVDVNNKMISNKNVASANILWRRILAFSESYEWYDTYTREYSSVFPDKPINKNLYKYMDHLKMAVDFCLENGYYLGIGEYSTYLDDQKYYQNEDLELDSLGIIK